MRLKPFFLLVLVKQFWSMRWLTLAAFAVTMIWGCTDEEDSIDFKTTYRNESGSNVTVTGYNVDNEIEFTYSLSDGEASQICEIPSPVFLGSDCAADSIIVRFQNNRGYICSIRLSDTENLCFPNDKSPFGGGDGGRGTVPSFYRKVAENTFEFLITQEDFENAFDLPE